MNLRVAARDARDPDRREAAAKRRRELNLLLLERRGDPDRAGALAEHLAHVSERLERIESEPADDDRGVAEALALRADLAWLPLHAPAELGDPAALLLAETAAVRTTARGVEIADEGAAAAAIVTARNDVFAVLVERLERRRRELLADEKAPLADLLETWLAADDLAHAGQETEAVGTALRPRIVERATAAPAEEASAVLGRYAEEAESRVVDALAAQSELPTERADAALLDARRAPEYLADVLDETIRARRASGEGKAALRPLVRWRKRLRRAMRRLGREAQEIGLQARLERIFGRRFTARFENLILWLIVAVMGILVAEAFLPNPWPEAGASPAEAARAEKWRPVVVTLAWIDAAICGVFLLEFLTKLSLVRGRASWFRRHFLIDLVPSIPYGLLAVHLLDPLRVGRLGRFARVPRLLRYFRAARPFVRLFRFFGFLQRGADRLVRLNGPLLNRNVVLFEPAPVRSDESPWEAIGARLTEARALARRTIRRHGRALSPEVRSERIREYVAALPPREALAATPAPAEGAPRREILRVEDLLAGLSRLDAGGVEAELGEAGAERFAATLSRLDLPVVRLFPGVREMVRAARGGEPLERVARAGRALGRWLAGLLDAATWVSDLSGVVSGPQFLDRLGAGMVQATARPARRLLVFGLLFLLLNGMVLLLWDVPRFRQDIDGAAYLVEGATGRRWALDDTGQRIPYDPPALVVLTVWLRRILGTPFLILGGLCLAVLVLGTWFRRIAGEATDFYTRTAEAQYISLLKSAKLANLSADLALLDDRVLRPEALLDGPAPPGGGEALAARFGGGPAAGEAGDAAHERVLQLYRDYLDGALFHHSDTKTTSQLLGNLALENIRSERLRTSRRERRRLSELDLVRERSALRGPYLWFRSINHSVAQWTARLLLDYNRHAIPAAEQASFPPDTWDAFTAWLDRREQGARAGEAPAAGDGEPPAFVTTHFTALHFLTADPERDRLVAERFGERTLAVLRADRQAMIRTIFGTFPFHRLPRADRTVNPFHLYGRYLANGRAVLLPFYFARLFFRAIRWLFRRVRETIREILHSGQLHPRRENWAPVEVAVRKINRMRKPLFLECTRFRARFDPEYLGLSLRPDTESGIEGRTWREDLDLIGATEPEREEFAALREERAEALHDFAERVEAAGGAEPFLDAVRRGRPVRRPPEALRAAAMAWAIDYRDVRTLSGLRERVAEITADAIARRGRVPGAGWLRRFLRLFLPAGRLKLAWREYAARGGEPPLPDRERRWVLRALRADYRDLDRLVSIAAALPAGTTPAEAAREVLDEVVRRPESWSEQLLTLRAVQSLSVLDVVNYRRQVRELGGFENG